MWWTNTWIDGYSGGKTVDAKRVVEVELEKIVNLMAITKIEILEYQGC